MADDGNLNDTGQRLFHLRRIGPQATKPGVVDRMDFYKVTSLIGRNMDQVDFLLDSTNHIQRLCLSRCHARLVLQGMNQHRLYDDSLNGVFVNNIKIAGSCLLREGDRVTFGHPSGSKLPCGSRARQPDSEHQFLFEKCNCTGSQQKSVDSEDQGSKVDRVCEFKVPSGTLSGNQMKKRGRVPTQSFTQEDIIQLKTAHNAQSEKPEESVAISTDEGGVKQLNQCDKSSSQTVPESTLPPNGVTADKVPCDNSDKKDVQIGLNMLDKVQGSLSHEDEIDHSQTDIITADSGDGGVEKKKLCVETVPHRLEKAVENIMQDLASIRTIVESPSKQNRTVDISPPTKSPSKDACIQTSQSLNEEVEKGDTYLTDHYVNVVESKVCAGTSTDELCDANNEEVNLCPQSAIEVECKVAGQAASSVDVGSEHVNSDKRFCEDSSSFECVLMTHKEGYDEIKDSLHVSSEEQNVSLFLSDSIEYDMDEDDVSSTVSENVDNDLVGEDCEEESNHDLDGHEDTKSAESGTTQGVSEEAEDKNGKNTIAKTECETEFTTKASNEGIKIDNPIHTSETSDEESETVDPTHTRETSDEESETINPTHTRETLDNEKENVIPTHTIETSDEESEIMNPTHTRETSDEESETINPTHTRETSDEESEIINPTHTRETSDEESETINPTHTRETLDDEKENVIPTHTIETSDEESIIINPTHTMETSDEESETINPAHTKETSDEESKIINPTHTMETSDEESETINPTHTRETSDEESETINPTHTKEPSDEESEIINPTHTRETSDEESETINPTHTRETSDEESETINPKHTKETSDEESEIINPTHTRETSDEESETINPTQTKETKDEASEIMNPTHISAIPTHKKETSDDERESEIQMHTRESMDEESKTINFSSYECVLMTHKEGHDEIKDRLHVSSEEQNVSLFLSDSIEYDLDEDDVSSTVSENVDNDLVGEDCEEESNHDLDGHEDTKSAESGTTQGVSEEAEDKNGKTTIAKTECETEFTTKASNEGIKIDNPIHTSETLDEESETVDPTHTRETSDEESESAIPAHTIETLDEESETINPTHTRETSDEESETINPSNTRENSNQESESILPAHSSETSDEKPETINPKHTRKTSDEEDETTNPTHTWETFDGECENVNSADIEDTTGDENNLPDQNKVRTSKVEELSKVYNTGEIESYHTTLGQNDKETTFERPEDHKTRGIKDTMEASEGCVIGITYVLGDVLSQNVTKPAVVEDRVELSTDIDENENGDECDNRKQLNIRSVSNCTTDNCQDYDQEIQVLPFSNGNACTSSKRKATDYVESETRNKRECIENNELQQSGSEKCHSEKSSKSGISKVAKAVKNFFTKWSSKRSYSLKDKSKQSYIYAEDKRGLYHLVDFEKKPTKVDDKMDKPTPPVNNESPFASQNTMGEYKLMECDGVNKQDVVLCQSESLVDEVWDPPVDQTGDLQQPDCALQVTSNIQVRCEENQSENGMSRVECNKVLSAYEIHRHLEPSCTQPMMCNDGPQKPKITNHQSTVANQSCPIEGSASVSYDECMSGDLQPQESVSVNTVGNSSPYRPSTPDRLEECIVESSQISSPVIDRVGVKCLITGDAMSPIVPKQNSYRSTRDCDDKTDQDNKAVGSDETDQKKKAVRSEIGVVDSSKDIEPLSCTFSDYSLDTISHPDIDFTYLNSSNEQDITETVEPEKVIDLCNDSSNEHDVTETVEPDEDRDMCNDSDSDKEESESDIDRDEDEYYSDGMDYLDDESGLEALSDEDQDGIEEPEDEEEFNSYEEEEENNTDTDKDREQTDNKGPLNFVSEQPTEKAIKIEINGSVITIESEANNAVKRKCDFSKECSPKRVKSSENVEIDGIFEMSIPSPNINTTDLADQTVESNEIYSTQTPNISDDLSCAQTPNLSNISSTQLGVMEEKLMDKLNDPERSKSSKSKAKDLLARLKARRKVKTEAREDTATGASSPVPGTSEEGMERQHGLDQSCTRGDQLNSDEVNKHVGRVREVVCQLRQSFDGEVSLKDNPRVMAWRHELAEVEKKLVLPRTVIAVVGDTGAGKSSLMNALLDHRSVLPTSGMRACTAVVVQVVHNAKSNQFEADIEFLQPKEWYNELQILLRDLTGLDGQIKKGQPDPASDAYVSYCKVKAVYGMIDTFQILSRYNTVTRWLGKTRMIKSSKPEDFRCAVERYIESQDAGTGGQYWPIVKHVTLRMPKCDVCSSGAALVDLPGVRDSNAARDKIAKEYLKNCTAVWVVSSIHRAIDDKTAKDLLGENFRRQLLMDGQYGSIAFICTKTDVLMPSEIIKPLKLEDQTRVHEVKVRELEEEKSDESLTVSRCTQHIQQLQDTIETLTGEVQDLRENLTEIRALLDTDDADSEQTEEVEALTEYQQEVDDKEAQIQKAHVQIAQLNTEKQQAIQKIHVLENELIILRRKITAICAKARNEYSKTEIRRDFKAGLKEMKRRAGMVPEDEGEESEEEEDHMEEDESIGSTADNLKVFCCSSTEYQKLKNLLTDDGPAQVFSSLDDTEVPALRSYVHEMTSVRRRQAMERLIRSLGRFVFDLQSYTTTGAYMSGDRAGAKHVIERQLQQLDQALAPVIRQLQADIDTVFDGSIRPKMKEGAGNASAEANNTCAKWGAPVCRDKNQDRRTGGLHWATYRATVRRQGVYTSRSFGALDMNEELSEPMYRSMTIVWDKAFSGMLWRVLDKLKTAIVGQIQLWIRSVCQQLEQKGVPADRSARTGAQLLGSASNKLTEMVNHLKELTTERQRSISRIVTPLVQEKLTPTYDQCAAESGKGMYMRIKALMNQGIDRQKVAMFDTATNDLMQALIDLQMEIVAYVRQVCQALMSDLQAAFEPLWDTPTNSSNLRSAFLQPVTKACASVREIYRLAGLQNTEEKVCAQSGPDQPAVPSHGTLHSLLVTHPPTMPSNRPTTNGSALIVSSSTNDNVMIKVEPSGCSQASVRTTSDSDRVLIKQETKGNSGAANTVIPPPRSLLTGQPQRTASPVVVVSQNQGVCKPSAAASVNTKPLKFVSLSQGNTQRGTTPTPQYGIMKKVNGVMVLEPVQVVSLPTGQVAIPVPKTQTNCNQGVVSQGNRGIGTESARISPVPSVSYQCTPGTPSSSGTVIVYNKENINSSNVQTNIKTEPLQIKTEPGSGQPGKKRRRKEVGFIDLTGD